jgi:2,5-diketo-D-gluconate reductase B
MMFEGGARIPLVGLGTWSLRGRICVDIVERALRLGYRHIDTAESYENEREVGDGLRASGVQRDNIFLTTKISPSHFAPPDLRRAAKDSLSRLRLSEVDLLLLHYPNPQIPLSDTLGALCMVKRAGLTRHIGVSNFTVANIQQAIRHASEPLVCNQIEMNSFLHRPKLIAACRANGMAVVAYSPIARGEANNDSVLARIGRAYGKSGSQVSLRWLVQQGISVIPRTSQIERLHENYTIFDFELSEAEMSEISSIARRRSRLAAVMSPLRACALRILPDPARSVLRTGYRKLRGVIR